MFEKKIAGVTVRWLVAGAIALLALLIITTLGGYIAYANAISASAANADVLRKELDPKIKAQEASLAQLRTQENASAEKQSQQEKTIIALRNDADKLTKQVAALETDRTRLQMQVLLLKASGKVMRAVVHLTDLSPGLAQRDLAAAIDALAQAQTLATDDKRNAIGELRASLAELRGSIEAKAYPISTLEILGDKIDDLIGQ